VVADDSFALVQNSTPQHLTADEVERLEKVYATGRRQLFRWIKEGAPLRDPAAMPAWWVAHRTWGVPKKIIQAAAAAAPQPPPLSGVSSPTEKSAKSVDSEESLKISEFELGEGQAVVQQRQLVAALFSKLSTAYENGVGIDVAQSRYDRAAESLRKLEVSDRADKKQRGDLIPKRVVISDIHSACEFLRHMRDSMERRVAELCPALTGELRDQVGAAIRKVREQEDRIFLNLECLKSPRDVVDLLPG